MAGDGDPLAADGQTLESGSAHMTDHLLQSSWDARNDHCEVLEAAGSSELGHFEVAHKAGQRRRSWSGRVLLQSCYDC